MLGWPNLSQAIRVVACGAHRRQDAKQMWPTARGVKDTEVKGMLNGA